MPAGNHPDLSPEDLRGARLLLARWRVPRDAQDDLLQEAALLLHRAQVTEPEPVRSPARYFFGCLHRLLREEYRERLKSRSLRSLDASDGYLLDTLESPCTSPLPRTLLLQVLRRLRPRQRWLLSLAYIHGLTPSELAPLLACLPRSVPKLRRRALAAAASVLRSTPYRTFRSPG